MYHTEQMLDNTLMVLHSTEKPVIQKTPSIVDKRPHTCIERWNVMSRALKCTEHKTEVQIPHGILKVQHFYVEVKFEGNHTKLSFLSYTSGQNKWHSLKCYVARILYLADTGQRAGEVLKKCQLQ